MAFDSSTSGEICENTVFSNSDRTIASDDVVLIIDKYYAQALSETTLVLDGVTTDYKLYFEIDADSLATGGSDESVFGILHYDDWQTNKCTDPGCNCWYTDYHGCQILLRPDGSPYKIETLVRYGYPGSFSSTGTITSGDVFGVAVWLQWDSGSSYYAYKVWLSQNGTWLNSGDPTDFDDTGYVVNGTFDPATYNKLKVFAWTTLQLTEQFGSTNQTYSAPSGYTAFDELADTSPFYKELDEYLGVNEDGEPLRQSLLTNAETASLSSAALGNYGFRLSQASGFDDAITVSAGKLVEEVLGVSPALASNAIQTIIAAAYSGLSESVVLGFPKTASDSVGFDDAFVVGVGHILASAFGISPSLGTLIKAYQSEGDGTGFNDETGFQFELVTDDAIGIAEDFSLLYAFSVVLSDAAGADDSAAAAAGFIHVVADDLGIGEAPSTLVEVIESVSETAALGGIIRLPDAEYVAWVVNSENLALSRYSGYAFNSMSAFRNTYLGATDTGIYELEGDDDAGTDIDARIRTGLMEFGSSRKKAMPAAYLGYTADGSLGLKVTTTDGGTRTETWYKLTVTKDAPDTARIPVGKGLKARYWGFELVNVDSADFEVDHLHLYPVVLTRRI